jgi:dynactin-6
MELKPPSPTKSPVKRSSASPTKSGSPSKSAVPDPNLRLHTNSLCAKDTKIGLTQGTLTLRSNSIIHPKVQITTTREGLVLGRCSIISERSVVTETVRIGDYVLIEAGGRIAAKEIGDDTVIESAAVLGERSVIGNNCRICAGEIIGEDEVIPDGTVVFGNGKRRKDTTDQVLPYTMQMLM